MCVCFHQLFNRDSSEATSTSWLDPFWYLTIFILNITCFGWQTEKGFTNKLEKSPTCKTNYVQKLKHGDMYFEYQDVFKHYWVNHSLGHNVISLLEKRTINEIITRHPFSTKLHLYSLKVTLYHSLTHFYIWYFSFDQNYWSNI